VGLKGRSGLPGRSFLVPQGAGSEGPGRHSELTPENKGLDWTRTGIESRKA
jgi:hypothetical protein